MILGAGLSLRLLYIQEDLSTPQKVVRFPENMGSAIQDNILWLYS
jgi:hypothetical protein